MALNTAVAAESNAPAITRALAQFVANHPSRGWTDAVDHEAHRTLLNWLGCAVGAAQHEAVRAALAAVQMLQPAPQAQLLGRDERVDMASAALLNGIASHTFDFDDTHLKTIIHPAGPVASALLALAEMTGASGRALIDALVLGIDVSCRVGNAVYPEHYDRGWHITGSTGMLGAAAGCARLLGLDEQQTTMALGIAASQPVGLREQFGTMTKPLHPGAAARAWLMAALMAQHGYTASPRALEAPRGLLQVVSSKCDWEQVTGELGQRFEISFNTYKPFACGIVVHPSIDACAQLRAQGVAPEQIERIELRVHSLVLELTGKKEPADGLAAKLSVYHGCAAGLMAALMARHGYTASPRALEAPRGLLQVVSPKCHWSEMTDGLGERFEISFNTYKPFACGIVIHPSIDACAQLRAQGVAPEQVERIELRVHSLVLELTGKKEPADGLAAKFSVYHGCAAGLTFDRAAEDEFSDEIVNRADMVALRRKVVATVDDSIDEASADVTAVLKDGRRVHVFVEHAIGSLQNPMTDANLEAKFHGLSDAVLGAAQTSELISACWAVGQAANVGALMALAAPRA